MKYGVHSGRSTALRSVVRFRKCIFHFIFKTEKKKKNPSVMNTQWFGGKAGALLLQITDTGIRHAGKGVPLHTEVNVPKLVKNDITAQLERPNNYKYV